MIIAVFGGAFDPFHSEHKKIIIACKKELKADKVIVVPSFFPPHKSNGISDYNDRLAMVKAGTKDLDYVIIDTIEYERNSINPTSVVLPILKEKYPCDEFYFVIGGDSMVHFHTWMEPQKVAETATLAVIARAGYYDHIQAIENAKKEYNASAVLLKETGGEISSSIIKATIELGLESPNVQNNVYNTIKERQLYTQFSHLINKLKQSIPKKTYEHAASTTLYAMKFIAKLSLDYKKVFVACILHDCAKHIVKEIEGVPSKVCHQFTGAELAQTEYNITDIEVLDAIRYHTSGKPNMTNLGKLVFVADMLEPTRNYEGVEQLREELEKNFEKGFFLCIKASMEKILKEKYPIYPLTKSCVEYYTKNRNNK